MPDSSHEPWPTLRVEDWIDTLQTLHMWTQIVGKVRLVQSPWVNHSWHVTLYVTARGLTTSPIPHGERLFQIDFDFVDHRLLVSTGEGVPYEAVRTADSPDETLLAFLDSTYAAAATTAGWDRTALERTFVP